MDIIRFPTPAQPDAGSPSLLGVSPSIPNGGDSGFAHSLGASRHMPDLMDALIRTHFDFEGWQQVLHPGPSMKATYSPAVSMAVRYASTPCREVAENCAVALAEQRLSELPHQEVQRLARDIIDTYLWHLQVGCGRSQAEWDLFNKAEDEEIRHELL